MTATIRFDDTHVLKLALDPDTLELAAVCIDETDGTVTQYVITIDE